MTNTKPDTSADGVITWAPDRDKILSGMSRRPWGEWVRISDYRALASERDQLRAQLATARNALDWIAAHGSTAHPADVHVRALKALKTGDSEDG